jgi:hypothetical protein
MFLGDVWVGVGLRGCAGGLDGVDPASEMREGKRRFIVTQCSRCNDQVFTFKSATAI